MGLSLTSFAELGFWIICFVSKVAKDRMKVGRVEDAHVVIDVEQASGVKEEKKDSFSHKA